jgi:hypothetical protein
VTDPRTDPRTLDPDLLGRWVAIASLLASAQELDERGGGAWRPLALVAADNAVESILGTIASSLGEPPGRDATFEQTLQLAEAALAGGANAIDQSLRTRILTTHRHRNAAVHHGAEPAGRAVARAIETALELRQRAIDSLTLLEAFRDSGPASAVGRLVGLEPIATPLTKAERFLVEGELLSAADQCAIALHEAIERVKPGLRTYELLSRGRMRDRVDELDEMVREQNRLHEAWILAIGLGIRPVELSRLRRVLGEPIYLINGGGEPDSVDRSEIELTEALVSWALRTTTDVIFRLWQSESLSPNPWPYLEVD